MKTLRDAINAERFVLTGQLRLHQDDGCEEVVQQAQTLSPAVDAVAITDCPYGVLHMAGLAVSSILLESGIDPLLQLTSRDRNRIALKSELLGAAALGVNNLLLQRGDPLPNDVQPATKQVFDTGAKRFLATAKQLSDFRAASGHPELFLGTLATVFEPDENWKPVELTAKVDAGARFVQTQICFDMDLLRRYMRFLVAAKLTWRCHVIVSVPVLTTAAEARWLYENLRGSTFPESIVHRFEDAKDPEQFGIEYSAEILNTLKEIPGVSGANLSTPGNPTAVVTAIDQAAL